MSSGPSGAAEGAPSPGRAEDAHSPGPSGDASAPAAEGEAPAPKRRLGRNLPVAVGVGVLLGALVLVSLYTVKEIFLGVLAAFLLVGLHELNGAFATRGIRAPLIPAAAGTVATAVASYAWGPTGLVAAAALTILGVLVWRMPQGADGYVRDAAAGLFMVGYLVVMGGIAALLLRPGDGDDRIVVFVAVTVASDIGGFFAGSFFGRHKLAPSISPKKTWEGVTGSAAACMAVGAWLVWWLLDGRLWQGAVIGAAAVVTATVGDLVESMIKRDLGIKDMGTLLPEHGGVMDRLDSLIATLPVVWLLLELFVPAP
ncbi:phosphatidate cytidylyltransferase [Actinomadura keratinilytica]|uniref:phosphatidate cytidylyltransferase n=1 Tax=Actinomadura keratinilytica TaxID=547461 RepID=UPI0031E9D872